MKKIAIIGTQGVPAKYGGFETMVENIITQKPAQEIEYTVFCSSKDYQKKLFRYKNTELKYVPLHANGVQSIPYDIISLIQVLLGKYDTVLILGISGCIFLPLFRLFSSKRIVVNIDGLEHRRGKWGKVTKRFLYLSESIAIRFANAIVVDNKGIQEYVDKNYHKPSTLIAYGGDHALKNVSEERQKEILHTYNLKPQTYSLAICRIEPENNCRLILEAFSKTNQTLVFIGNWQRSKYGRKLKEKYKNYAHISFIDSLYEIQTLYALRNHCKYYIHGHSAGGTNPSLVEAMFIGCPILAFNCVYNKETTGYKARYFKNENDIISLLSIDENEIRRNGKEMSKIASERYTWKSIIEKYEKLY